MHSKDFYAVYTKHFNPSLFELGEKKKTIKTIIPQKTNADIFQKLFGSADKKKVAKKKNNPNLL